MRMGGGDVRRSPGRPQLQLGISGLLDRVSEAAGAGYTRLSMPVPASPRASSVPSPRLFDLGEEDEGSDAVELPYEFSLPTRGS